MTDNGAKSDLPSALAKGVLGAIPVVGPIVAEVLGTLLPSRRLERVEKLLTRLSEQVHGLDEDRLRTRFRSPEFVDLFEDGVFQAARALNDERIQYVASILKSGITSEREEFLEEKTVLGLLGELNDVEIVLLRSYARPVQEDEEFLSKHAATLEPKLSSMDSSRRELDDHTAREAYLAHLARLGLLRPHFRRPRRGELPEFDDRTGMIKASGYELTPLGYLLLARVELLSDEERP
jgi:hypothetical protein